MAWKQLWVTRKIKLMLTKALTGMGAADLKLPLHDLQLLSTQPHTAVPWAGVEAARNYRPLSLLCLSLAWVLLPPGYEE